MPLTSLLFRLNAINASIFFRLNAFNAAIFFSKTLFTPIIFQKNVVNAANFPVKLP